jgi:hypothetical protein
VISRPIATDAVDDPGENFYLELRVIDFAGTITAYSPPVIILTPYVPPPYDGGGSYDYGGDSPSAPSDSCSPGFDSNSNSCTADGAGGGDKIICTAMNDHYGFGSFRNAIWLAYADRHLTKAHEVGYHTIFLPLVKFGFKQGNGRLNLLVRSILEWGTRHRAIDLRAEMRGGRRDLQGRIIRMIFEPLCYIVGKLKGY